MGWFSAKKKTYVSSVVYPLGEDGADRTDMLKYTVLNSILQQKGVGDSIRETFLHGQGIAMRNAFRYARDTYTNGLPMSEASFVDQPNLSMVTPILAALNPGYDIKYVTTVIGTADYEWWAEQYLAEYHGYDRTLRRFDAPPLGVEVDANVAFDLEPDGSVQILLMNADGATTVLAFQPADHVHMGVYVHSAYQLQHTFDKGERSIPRPAEPGEQERTYFTTEEIHRTGETQLVTTKTVVSLSGSMATDLISTTVLVTTRPKYFLYRLGSGTYPELDALLNSGMMAAPYFPSIPLRVDNVDWTSKARQDTDLYKTSAKLMSKLGLDIEDISESINTNKDIKEIDYCFVVAGVQLNTKSPEGKRYLFRFFDYLRNISQVNRSTYSAWESDYDSKFPNGPIVSDLPTGGVATAPTNTLRVYSQKDRANNHDIKLQWQYIDTQLLSGTVEPNAKPGTVTVSMGSGVIQRDMLDDMVLDSSLLYVRKQVDENTFVQLTISGLVYENFIYQGKSVIVTAHDAMSDPDEEGFLVPMNQQILRETPMVEATNLSYQCMFLVFNCYKVVKQKWYQTTLFKIIIVIIAIIITVFSMGTASAASAGMVGAAFSVAAVLGATGIMLTILAATLYVLAMMVLASIIMKASTKLFGEKWGAIIGAIVSIIAMNYASTGTMLGTAANSSSNILTAQNIIQASSAVMAGYTQSKLAGINKDLQKITDNYNDGMAKIEELTEEFLGTNLDIIDVTGFTQATYEINYELADTFLSRTLLTGSDIAMVTSGLIDNFADVGLQLPTTG